MVTQLVACLLLLSPAQRVPAYGGTTWGMGPAQVARAFPGGRVEEQKPGRSLAVYRTVLSRPFGAPGKAVASFLIGPGGLSLLVLEFPSGKSVQPGVEYERPTVRAAEALRVKLSEGLTKRFGKPDQEKAGPGGSSIGWGMGPTYAVVQTRNIASDRQDVRVVLAVDGSIVPLTERDNEAFTELKTQLIDGVFVRQDQARWSPGGAMGLRWGMGPGDVHDIYPELRASSVSSAYEPLSTYTVRTFAESDVELSLKFFRGQLVEIWVDRLSYYHGLEGDSLAMEWDITERWRTKVLDILTEKYGPPFEQATAEQLEAALAKKGSQGSLFWRWQREDTGIEFKRNNKAVQILTYLSIGELGRQAWDAQEEYRRAEESARKSKF